MEFINGYKKVKYNEFVKALKEAFKIVGENELALALYCNVKSQTTARNVFAMDEQVVADKALAKAISYLKVDAIIAYVSGERTYLLKK